MARGVRGIFAICLLSLFLCLLLCQQGPAWAFKPASLASGQDNTCVILRDGSLDCYGSTLNVFGPSEPSGTFTAVSMGLRHACAIRTNGTLECWGERYNEGLDAPGGSFTAITSGEEYSCGIRTDGMGTCWGRYDDGDRMLVHIYGGDLEPLSDIVEISAGHQHTCAIRRNGTLICWGDNDYGQVNAPGGTFMAIAAGGYHTCGIKTDGTVLCWGKNDYGQVNAPGGTFTAIATGTYHTCGIQTDGTVACWGRNSAAGESTPPEGTFIDISAQAQLTCGIRTNGLLTCWGTTYMAPPNDLLACRTQNLDAGAYHSCTRKADGALSCWGWNSDGQTIAPSESIHQVSSGAFHTCGLRADNTPTCWGLDLFGQSTAPDVTLLKLSAGGNHSCGLQPDSTLTCWGANDQGQATPPEGTYKGLSTGGNHSCGLQTDSTLTCWGANDQGQATAPGGLFLDFSTGNSHTCGIRVSGMIECWGNNNYGKSTPPEGTFHTLSMGPAHNCAIRSNGSLSCWGNNTYGQASPPDGVFINVSVGTEHSCATREDGVIACWGRNHVEQLRLTFAPEELSDGLFNQAYAQTLSGAGGTEPYLFTIPRGGLPTGLTLTASGEISGTPLIKGTFPLRFGLTSTVEGEIYEAYYDRPLRIACPPGYSGSDCTLTTCGDDILVGDEDCESTDGEFSDCCDADTCTFRSAGSSCGDATENDCNHADTCDGAGLCQSNLETQGASCGEAPTECSDQDTCNGEGLCLDNDLSFGTLCGDDGTECTNQDFCNGFGTCYDAGFVAQGASCGEAPTECSDQDTCNGSGFCQVNDLHAGTACGDDGTECINQDTCDGFGVCTDKGFVASGTACNADDNGCTVDDACENGVCLAGDDADCSGATDQCNIGRCNATSMDTYECLGDTSIYEGRSCTDENACTWNDTCQGGVCLGVTATCDDGVDCTEDSCDTESGECVYTANDAACDDGENCTSDYCDLTNDCQSLALDDWTDCSDEDEQACFAGVCEALGQNDRCAEAVALTLGEAVTASLGGFHSFRSVPETCGDSSGTSGADAFYSLAVAEAGRYLIELSAGANEDLGLALLASCEDADSCMDYLDQASQGETESLDVELDSDLVLQVILLNRMGDTPEDFTLTVTALVDEDGDIDGDEDGDIDGDEDGDIDGDEDGDTDGDEDGDIDGDEDGDTDGDEDGDITDDDDDDEPCVQGTEACACNEDDSCEGSLLCLSGVCIDASSLTDDDDDVTDDDDDDDDMTDDDDDIISDDDDSCAAGAETCSCEDSACNEGLVCLSGICVDPTDICESGEELPEELLTLCQALEGSGDSVSSKDDGGCRSVNTGAAFASLLMLLAGMALRRKGWNLK